MKQVAHALARMKVAASASFGDKLGTPVDTETELRELKSRISSLGAKNTRGARQSPTIVKSAMDSWAGSGGDLQSLTSRQVRALCTVAEVATSPRFVAGLEQHEEFPARRRWIEGLIGSYFSAWRPPEAPALEALLQRGIKGFDG